MCAWRAARATRTVAVRRATRAIRCGTHARCRTSRRSCRSAARRRRSPTPASRPRRRSASARAPVAAIGSAGPVALFETADSIASWPPVALVGEAIRAPAIAASGSMMIAAWRAQPGVELALSTDHGASWSVPRDLAGADDCGDCSAPAVAREQRRGRRARVRQRVGRHSRATLARCGQDVRAGARGRGRDCRRPRSSIAGGALHLAVLAGSALRKLRLGDAADRVRVADRDQRRQPARRALADVLRRARSSRSTVARRRVFGRVCSRRSRRDLGARDRGIARRRQDLDAHADRRWLRDPHGARARARRRHRRLARDVLRQRRGTGPLRPRDVHARRDARVLAARRDLGTAVRRTRDGAASARRSSASARR